MSIYGFISYNNFVRFLLHILPFILENSIIPDLENDLLKFHEKREEKHKNEKNVN